MAMDNGYYEKLEDRFAEFNDPRNDILDSAESLAQIRDVLWPQAMRRSQSLNAWISTLVHDHQQHPVTAMLGQLPSIADGVVRRLNDRISELDEQISDEGGDLFARAREADERASAQEFSELLSGCFS